MLLNCELIKRLPVRRTCLRKQDFLKAVLWYVAIDYCSQCIRVCTLYQSTYNSAWIYLMCIIQTFITHCYIMFLAACWSSTSQNTYLRNTQSKLIYYHFNFMCFYISFLTVRWLSTSQNTCWRNTQSKLTYYHFNFVFLYCFSDSALIVNFPECLLKKYPE